MTFLRDFLAAVIDAFILRMLTDIEVWGDDE